MHSGVESQDEVIERFAKVDWGGMTQVQEAVEEELLQLRRGEEGRGGEGGGGRGRRCGRLGG